jgi:hypothetical protein
MSPRKTILRELSREQSNNDSRYQRPSTLAGFSSAPEKYQKAVNELLSSRLVDGHKDAEGHMAIAINEHRLSDVQRELRPVWARPAVWAMVAALVIAMGAGLAI